MTTKSIRDIRSLYDIRDVLGLKSKKKLIVCPLPGHAHRHNTPSFSIFFGRDGVQRFECHGNCAKRGDVIDLVGNMQISGYDDKDPDMVNRAISLLVSGYEFAPDGITVLPARPAMKQDLARKYTPPSEEIVEYARSRGLSKETLDVFQVGSSGHMMTIPAFMHGELIGIKKRDVRYDGDLYPVKYIQERGSKAGIFNYDPVYMTSEPVLVVKGEIPVMLLYQYGILACSSNIGERHLYSGLKEALAFSRKIIVVGDNDETGIESARSRSDMLGAEMRFQPEGYKDIDEWILKDEKAIEVITSWLSAS